MEIGSIVEFIDRQKILCAAVLEVKSSRLRLLTENDREVNLAANRIAHKSDIHLNLSLGRNVIVQTLKETAHRRSALIEKIDVKGLWEVLNSEQEWIDLTTMTEFAFPGAPSFDHQSAVVRAFFRDRIFFKFNADSFFPYTERQVRQVTARAEKEAKKERLVLEGSKWLKGVLKDQTSNYSKEDINAHTAIIKILASFFLFGKESETSDIAKNILLRSGIKNPEDIFGILVKIGFWHPDENLDLLQFEIPVKFSEEIRSCADNLSNKSPASFFETSSENHRRDLTDLHTITIDGQATLDFDDAISVENKGDHYLLWVHIADVGHSVQKDSIIDKEALARGSSIYMPDDKISMIPPVLAENLCSLVTEVERPAISLKATLAQTGEVQDYEIFPSVIRIKQRLTYYDANTLLDESGDLTLLYKIGRLFRQKRLSQGAVQINLPEVSVWLDDKGNPNIARVDRESPSRMFVSEVMILANWLMARFLGAHQMPAIFRSQPAPKQHLFQGEVSSLFLNWMQRKYLSRFVLGTTPEPHSGLGLDAYLTATSPIRKYFDLIAQRQIRAVLGIESPYTNEDISQFLQLLEQPMRNTGRIQFRRNRYWLLKSLEKSIGKKEEAIVLSKRKDGYQILIPEFMIECFMPSPGNIKLKPEDYLQVTLQHVNARRDKLTVYMG
jgi:exoribonuclease II